MESQNPPRGSRTGDKVEVNERVNLNVAVKLNAGVDVEVMDDAHDPQRWLGSSLFDTT